MLVKQKIINGRRKLGISTPQLAEMIDVNQGTINRYEHGTIKTIPTEKLKKLAEVLGYSFEEFISGDPRYSMLVEEPTNMQPIEMSEYDMVLITKLRRLPREYQELIEQFISVAGKDEH